MEHVLYFVGLVMCSVSVASLYSKPEYGFLILGTGLILWPVFTRLIGPVIRKWTRR